MRPKKVDDLTTKRIVAAIEAGGTRRCAAQAAGIAPATLSNWLSKGRRGDPDYSAFFARVERAEAAAETTMVDVVVTAAKTDPKLALEWLTRRRPATWGTKREPPKRSAEPENLTKMTDAELVAAFVDSCVGFAHEIGPEHLATLEAEIAKVRAARGS